MQNISLYVIIYYTLFLGHTMQYYTTQQLSTIVAVQFTGKQEDIPVDLLSISTLYRKPSSLVSHESAVGQKIEFFEFKIGDFPMKVQLGDWLVKKENNNQYLVVPNSLFELLFSPL